MLGPGLGVEQGRLHATVIFEQGQVHLFLPWQRHLWACTSSGGDKVKLDTRQQQGASSAASSSSCKFYYPNRCVGGKWNAHKHARTHTRVNLDLVGGYEYIRHLLKWSSSITPFFSLLHTLLMHFSQPPWSDLTQTPCVSHPTRNCPSTGKECQICGRWWVGEQLLWKKKRAEITGVETEV